MNLFIDNLILRIAKKSDAKDIAKNMGKFEKGF
jgi:hypothetical protein